LSSWRDVRNFASQKFRLTPMSGKIYDLCEISHLLLFVSNFASKNKKFKFNNYFFDVCCRSQRQCLFCHQYADGNCLAGAIVPPVRSLAETKQI